MTNKEAIKHLENMKWLKGYDNTTIGDEPLADIIDKMIELLKEQQAEIEYMKSEKTDAIEEIEREISVRERDPEYKTFSRGIVNGLEMALRIINEKGR